METTLAARKAMIISGDMSREHVSKACDLAEILSRRMQVELLAFRFPDDDGQALFEAAPVKARQFRGCDFPDFFSEMAKALNVIRGNRLYVFDPRLPSLGLALMANYHRGIPIAVEAIDTARSAKPLQNLDDEIARAAGEPSAPLRDPRSKMWVDILDPLVTGIPISSGSNQTVDRPGEQQIESKRQTYDVAQRFARTLARFHETIVSA